MSVSELGLLRVDFRAAPRTTPIQKWLNIRKDGGWSVFDSKEEAEKYTNADTKEIVHLREVIE